MYTLLYRRKYAEFCEEIETNLTRKITVTSKKTLHNNNLIYNDCLVHVTAVVKRYKTSVSVY